MSLYDNTRSRVYDRLTIPELKDKYTKAEDEEYEDEIDFMIKQRIARDEQRYVSSQALKSKQDRERVQREVLGSAAFTEKKLSDYKTKEKERRDAEKLTLPEDIERRRAEREARKDEVRETLAQTSEMDEMRRRWAREDNARAKQAAEDAAYEREKKWARQDSKKEAVKMERERYRADRALRVEELAVKHKIRENEYQTKQEKDAFDAEHWQKQAAAKKREINRSIRSVDENTADSSRTKPMELTDDPYSYLAFLEPSTKRDGRDYRRRILESERNNDEMKQWYLDREFERGEHRIRANRTINAGRRY